LSSSHGEDVPIDPLLLQVAERVRLEAGVRAAADPVNVLEWAMRYRRPEGQPFSMERFKPIEQIYRDDWPRIVIKKPAQRGISEYAICLVCFALEHGAKLWASGLKNGLNVAYLFPVKQDLEDFAKERINELREESTHLAVLFSDEEFDSLGFKKVGRSHLYMRGTYAKAGLLSFPADMLIYDEFDQMDTKAVALAARRMAASPVRREVKISTPTFPGRGISSAYLNSDRRIYETQCPSCERWVSFEFHRDVFCDDEPWDNWKHWTQERIAMSRVSLHCPGCDAEIDDTARCAEGRWRAQNPDNTRIHGYQVPWWPFPMTDMLELAIKAVETDPHEIEEFYRSDLGLEYGAGGNAVTEEMLFRLTSEYPTDIREVRWSNTTLGCDVGSRLHYRVSSEDANGVTHVRDMGAVDEWEELDHLMLRYQVRLAVIDAEPEIHDAVKFCKRWPGRAKRGFEQTRTSALQGVIFHEKPVSKQAPFDVQINRTIAMDAVYAELAGGRERWPESIVRDPEVVEHMTSPTRVKVSDDTGQVRYEWIHTKPDHGFHACVFDLVARQMLSKVQVSLPVVGGGSRAVVANNYQKYANEKPIDKLLAADRTF
jgi:Phage terminase large subunit (GpA)